MPRVIEEQLHRGFLWEVGQFFGRSLLPIMALALIGGTFVWGPWVTLVLVFVWWRIVSATA